MQMETEKFDVLIIGAGLAGVMAALKLAPGKKVALVSKTEITGGNSPMAQGGIAAAISETDSVEDHVRDTLSAGAGLCNEEVVRKILSDGPDRVHELLNWGVPFDIDERERLDLTREGGHSKRRILHIKDHTGQELHRFLVGRAKEHPNITFFENHFAVDLLTNHLLNPEKIEETQCQGAWFIERESLKKRAFFASATILATGGAGKIYRYTSNWSGATGDGIAMAHRAGARVRHLEFMQFHPTCLYHPLSRNFLISESLRGEGAELVNSEGLAFMKRYHPMGSLAPRDIVARSIDEEIKKSGSECVFLDITHRSREYLKERFELIYTKCLEYGIDMAAQPIPVVPAAHYLCGGVQSNYDGTTDIKGLYALGETSCTGLHGANRLASNSLLECLVGAHWAAEHILRLEEPSASTDFSWTQVSRGGSSSVSEDEKIVVNHMWEEIRNLMWNYVGIVRSNRRLIRARDRLKQLHLELYDYYGNSELYPDLIELRNIAIVAELTVQCALTRKESVGIHYSLDYPP